jgi:pimeloyl-ACP methyl ester carboxylesterase
MVTYTPPEEDRALKLRVASELGQVHTFLEWRGYFGAHSVLSSGISRLVGRVALRFGDLSGFLVGTVVNHFGRAASQQDDDPSFLPRLRRLEAEFADDARRYPSLERAVSSVDSAAVFVHGTRSCSLVNLRELRWLHHVPLFRFEHDTFKSIHDNARELVEKVSRLNAKRLLFICHSRGGLVARLAALSLRNSTQIDLVTCGTPHLGTPLVTALRAGIRFLGDLGARMEGGVPVPDLSTAALGYLLPQTRIPVGVVQMCPDSDFLATLNHVDSDPARIIAFAGAFDPDAPAKGFAQSFRSQFATHAFGRVDNDLIVTVPSARGRYPGETVPNCSHFDYFSKDVVHAELNEFPSPLPPPPPSRPEETMKDRIEKIQRALIRRPNLSDRIARLNYFFELEGRLASATHPGVRKRLCDEYKQMEDELDLREKANNDEARE